MIEPTESYTKAELDRFKDAVNSIKNKIQKAPEKIAASPRFMPISRIDETAANRNPILSERLEKLPEIPKLKMKACDFLNLSISELEELWIKFKDSRPLNLQFFCKLREILSEAEMLCTVEHKDQSKIFLRLLYFSARKEFCKRIFANLSTL